MIKILLGLSVALTLSACSAAPSKAEVSELVMANSHGLAEVKINDLRCTERENEEYHCFVNYVQEVKGGGSMPRQAEDAIFRKANGAWETNIMAVSQYTFEPA